MQSKKPLDQLVRLLLLRVNQAAEDGCSSNPDGDIERRAPGTAGEQLDVRLIENHEAVEFGGQLIEMGAAIALLFVNEKADDLESEFGHVRIRQFTGAHTPSLGQQPGEHAAFRVAPTYIGTRAVQRSQQARSDIRLLKRLASRPCVTLHPTPTSISGEGIVRILSSQRESFS
jgi:hypothetical protein